jgi:flagellar protein FliS
VNPQAANNYLRTKVLTATPEQLQMLLFDGVIRFGEQARAALEQKKYEQSFKLLVRAQNIVNQLCCALNHEVSPDLCRKLAALYTFAYRRLVDANLKHNIKSLDEALNVLKYQRQTWSMVMERLSKEKAAAAAQRIDVPAPDARMETTISMQG